MANAAGEYGLFQLLDIGTLNPEQVVTTVDSGLLSSAVYMDNAQHNADINALLNLFADTTTDYQLSVGSMGSRRNQPLDENGRSIPVKPVAPYTVAFPIIGSGNAWGANYVTRQKMTVRNLAQTMSAMYRGDYQWVMDHVIGALLNSTNYTWTDPIHGALTIRGLANGDTTVYYNQYTNATATDTHYIAQTAPIADATNPFDDIYAELVEHPDNGGDVIAFIPSALKATTIALTEFNSATLDSDITLGVNTDRLTGTLGAVLPRGATLLGKTDSGVWIVEWPALPANNIVAITTEGPRPLARRQFAEPQLQGFFRAEDRADFPFREEQWMRWEGYAARNRVGAVAYQVNNADTTWDAVTGYGGLMP
jgi:hypothetical protein